MRLYIPFHTLFELLTKNIIYLCFSYIFGLTFYYILSVSLLYIH